MLRKLFFIALAFTLSPFVLQASTPGVDPVAPDSALAPAMPAISIAELSKSISLSVQPNPCNAGNTLHIKNNIAAPVAVNARIRLFDRWGRVIVKHESAMAETLALNVPRVASGEYFLQLYICDKFIIKKVMIN